MQISKTALTAKDRLIVALDVPTLDQACRLADQLRDDVGMLKVGLELYAKHGTEVFAAMEQFGLPLFFDCKFMDIPNTVASASRQLVGRQIEIFNVHATGGSAMMKETVRAVREESAKQNTVPPKIIAVTILTSLGSEALRDELGWHVPASDSVLRLAKLTKDSDMDGVVASALEAAQIREACGDDFLIVTPGVRPAWVEGKDDQVRAVTAAQAVSSGADYIVVGRPITRHAKPVDAAKRIVDEMSNSG